MCENCPEHNVNSEPVTEEPIKLPMENIQWLWAVVGVVSVVDVALAFYLSFC